MVFLEKLLPGLLVKKIGERASHWSESHHDVLTPEIQNKIRAFTRVHAEKSIKEKAFDWIVSGHTHVQDEYELPYKVQEKPGRSINLGSWHNGPTYFVLDENKGQFYKSMDWD